MFLLRDILQTGFVSLRESFSLKPLELAGGSTESSNEKERTYEKRKNWVRAQQGVKKEGLAPATTQVYP